MSRDVNRSQGPIEIKAELARAEHGPLAPLAPERVCVSRVDGLAADADEELGNAVGHDGTHAPMRTRSQVLDKCVAGPGRAPPMEQQDARRMLLALAACMLAEHVTGRS